MGGLCQLDNRGRMDSARSSEELAMLSVGFCKALKIKAFWGYSAVKCF